MTANALSVRFKSDLRAPLATRLRRGSLFGGFRVAAIVLLDCVVLALAWWLAEHLGTYMSSPWNAQENPRALLIILATQIGFLAAGGLYRAGEKRRDYFGLIRAITLSNILVLLLAFLYNPEQFVSRSTFIFSLIFGSSFICLERFLVDLTIEQCRKRGAACYPVFIFCKPEEVEKASKLLRKENRYILLGWSDVQALNQENLQETLEFITSLGVSEVFICSQIPLENPMFLYWNLRNAGVTLHILPLGLDPLFRRSEFWIIGGLPSITFAPPVITGIDFWLKQVFDFCAAVFLVVLLFPILFAISVLIKLDSPGPIFYKQTRVGLHGRPFKAWKFRTMVANAAELQKLLEERNEMKDGVLFKMKNDPRITRVGRYLRQSSLDELPQLFNVLMGEMSLVGPRPLPLRDVEKFSERHFIRHEVLPGITGLWQVSGRSNIDNFEDVVNLDIHYIENWSFWLDLKILLQTVKVVIGKTGAY
jgi:exopolysaccharide biosynthesis polyprenyl glycosylphosphotransferase